MPSSLGVELFLGKDERIMAPPQVLVVDDERASRLSLSEILRLDGCEVAAALSAGGVAADVALAASATASG